MLYSDVIQAIGTKYVQQEGNELLEGKELLSSVMLH